MDGPDPALAVPGASSGDGLVALREDRADRREGAPPTRVRDLVQHDRQAAIDVMLSTATPFRERLVWFWANHFTVSFRRDEARAVILPFVREAIRPHVTGRFADMLLAVMRHPAMLTYLDNTELIGPDSPFGRRSRRGLNENLARECLELHTVSPASGFTQADVTEFAKVLTGWSYEIGWNPPQFHFRLAAHQPGGKVLLGRRFDHGLGGGLDALAFLAGHPATHRHLATRLVRHFVADRPPPDAVARIEAVLRETDGDLKAAALAVARLPQAWTPLAKLRPPGEHVVAVMRALDPAGAERADLARPDIAGAMAGLGQPFLAAPLPNGWPDDAAAWSGGEGLLRRVDWLWGLSGQVRADPVALAEASLGPFLSSGTAQAIGHAGSRREALVLLFAAPEFLRR